MTIANGSTIDAADLNTLVETAVNAQISDRTAKPRGHYLSFQFFDVVAATAEHRRQTAFVIPRDCYVESVSVHTGDMVGTVTATITGDGALVNWPLEVTGTAASGATDLQRTFYDNTLSKTQDRGFRVLTQGATCTLTIETTSTTTPCVCTVTLVLRQFFGR